MSKPKPETASCRFCGKTIEAAAMSAAVRTCAGMMHRQCFAENTRIVDERMAQVPWLNHGGKSTEGTQ